MSQGHFFFNFWYIHPKYSSYQVQSWQTVFNENVEGKRCYGTVYFLIGSCKYLKITIFISQNLCKVGLNDIIRSNVQNFETFV